MRTGREDEMKDNDELVERTLEALGKVEAPEGLEARVLAGVERKVAAGRAVRSVATGAWWWGALSGAAMAMVCVGVVLLVQARIRTRVQEVGRGPRVVTREVGVVPVSAAAVVAVRPCGSSGAAGARSVVRVPRAEMMRVESVVPTRRVIEPGLTAEERELVRLARVADPGQIATLNPEVRAKVEAEDVAQFESFFYQPPVKVDGQSVDGQTETK